jgi:hypothetical protein
MTTDVEEVRGKPVDLDEARRRLFVDWSSFWARDHAGEDWLLEPLLLNGRSHLLYAPRGIGKSLLGLEAAIALATGRSMFHRHASEPMTVLYLDFEMLEQDLWDRLDKMGLGADDDLSHFLYALGARSKFGRLDTQLGGDRLARVAAEFGVQFVVIDTVTSAVGDAESDSDTFRSLTRHTVGPLKDRGIGVLRIDHAGKDLERGPRGSSAKEDDVDVVFQMTGKDDRFTLKCTKDRVGYIPTTIYVEREQLPLGHRLDTDPVAAKASKAIAKLLDAAGIPLDATNAATRAAIKKWNADHQGEPIKARNATLSAALRLRRERSTAEQIVLGAFPESAGNTTPGPTGES